MQLVFVFDPSLELEYMTADIIQSPWDKLWFDLLQLLPLEAIFSIGVM